MIATQEKIAAYARISFDIESDKDSNTSIENQKDIIRRYIEKHFPDCEVEYFVDRDRSGYTFSEREAYQQMRPRLLNGEFKTLVIKDFSRFSRRNGAGLTELEILAEHNVRIIAIDDNIDYPNAAEWFHIQVKFMLNEMPVTEASKKVRSVVRSRQEQGKWVCAVPYGYRILDTKEMTYAVVPEEAEVVKEIYRLYTDEGLGYHKIAKILTERNIPTPRAAEKARAEAAGKVYKKEVKNKWSLVTISTILSNDFYIGTLRQHKYARAGIKGKDVRVAEDDEIVHENAHVPIIDLATFMATQSLLERRTKSHYRGQKKNANLFSGFLVCGDCGSRLSTLSRGDNDEAYNCSTYSKLGKKHCTNHYVKGVDLDQIVRSYLIMIHATCGEMIKKLQADILRETEDTRQQEDTIEILQQQIDEANSKIDAYISLQAAELARKRMTITEVNKRYDPLIEAEYRRIDGLTNQINMLNDRRNNTIRVNRVAKTVIDILQGIIDKPHLDRQDLELLVEKIVVFQDKEVAPGATSGYKHIDIYLKSDIDSILRSGVLPGVVSAEDPENFTCDTVDILKTQLVRKIPKHADEVYSINVVSDGDPLEIYTEKDGGVIFRKYSPMSDLQDFAAQICESIGSVTGRIAAVADRDSIIALSGAPKRELMDKPNSPELDRLMEERTHYMCKPGDSPVRPTDATEKYQLGVASPILSQGDLMGCVMLLLNDDSAPVTEADRNLTKTIAGFLGKQMES